jgi:hypothetical protein
MLAIIFMTSRASECVQYKGGNFMTDGRFRSRATGLPWRLWGPRSRCPPAEIRLEPRLGVPTVKRNPMHMVDTRKGAILTNYFGG